MKPVTQTKFDDLNNSHSACIASILEKDITEVPNQLDTETWSDYLLRLYEWLRLFNLCYIEIERAGLINTDMNYLNYHLISGKSCRRNTSHYVVGFKGIIEFDPHPDRNGLLPEDSSNPYYYGFILQKLNW